MSGVKRPRHRKQAAAAAAAAASAQQSAPAPSTSSSTKRCYDAVIDHIREHQASENGVDERSCAQILATVQRDLGGLIDVNLVPDAKPSRVRELCIFVLVLSDLAPDLGQCGKLATFFAPTAGKELRELRYRCLSSLFQLMLKPPLTGGLLEGAAYAFIEVSSGDSSSSIIFDDAVKLLKDCAILLRINPWKAGSVVELSVFQGLAAVLEVPDEFGVRTMPVRAAEQVKCLQISITNLMPKILQKIPEVLSQDPGNILWVLLRHQLQNVKPDWQILLPTLKCMTELLDKYEKPPSHVLKCVCESVLALVGAVVEGGGEEVQDDCTFALAQFVTLLYRLHTASLPSPAYLLPALVLFCQGMHQPLTEAQVVLPKSVLRSVAACYSENIVGIKFLSALVGLMDIPELQQEAVECILSASKHVLRANPMWLPKEQVPTVGPVSEAALRETLSATVQLAKSPAPLGSPMLLSRVTFAIGARLLPYPSGQEVIAALDPISDMILIFRDFCELLLNRLEKGDKIQDGLISLVVDCSAAILHSLGEFLAKAGAPFRRKEILRQTVDLACLVSLRWVSSSHGAGTHRWPSQKSILQPDSKVHFFRQRTLLEVKSLPLHHRVFVLASNWEGTDPDPVPQHIALYLKFGMTNPEQNIQVMALREFPVLVEQALCTCGIDIWGPVFQPIVQAACKHEDEDVRVEMALALWQTALSFDLVEGPPPLEASCEITCQNDVVEVFSLGSDALKLKGSGMVPRLLFPFAVVLLKDSAVRVRTYAAHLAARIMSCERASVNIGAADAASFIAAVLEGLVPGSEGSPGTMALLVGELSAGSCMLAKLLEMMAPEGAGGGLGHMMTFFQSKLSAASAGVQSGSPESHIECMVLLQALGCIASSVDIDVAAGCSLFCWIMVLLIDIWTQKSLAIVHLALDQLLHIVRCARVPLWRVLEDDSRSERILPALVEKLLYHKESFTEFVSKVMEGGRDLKDFLTRHCRHILPTFVVNGKRSCLDQLASLYDEVLGNEISRLRLLTPGKSLASVFLYDVKGYGLASILRAVLLKGATEQRKDWSEFCILTDTYFQGNSPEALLKSTERKVVELLAWDLGGSEADTAMKALGRAAILVVGGDSANGTPMGSLSPNPKLSQLIANHFLFLMTHFTFKTRASRCAADEVKAIAVLGRLVQSMDPVRCAHFAPKIFSTLTAALAEPRESPALKEVAYTVLCGFVRGLPDSSFGSHPSLSTVVVALLPALSGVPKPLPQRVCDEVKSLLRYLIVTKRDTLKTYFKTIPFLPALPELEDVSSSLAAENGEPSLPEQLHELHSILQKEDSSSVRQATLGHLLYVLTQSRSELCALIVSGDSVHDSIVQLLSLLLRISSSVSDAKVSNLCAACLGHLGAIDPSRLLFSSARGEAMAKSAALGSASWNMDVLSMSLVLLRDHLVPCLRAAPASIDRVAFGIQELLSLIYREMGCRSSASVLQPGPNRGPMPGGVSDILKENGILDAVEPFWNSEYDVNEQSVSSPPFFSKGSLSLERWMSVWCRHLISSSCGPLKEVFRACRGAVRAHLGTANFLLPHLVCDAVLFGEDSDRAAAAEEVTSVLSEAAKVHKSDSSSGMKGADVQHIAVQCVFSLLDQLTKWSSREENKTSVVRESWRSTDGTRAGALTSFLQNIPWELLVSASKHIRAYTRALLYLEDHIRSSHKRDHAQSKGGVPNYRDGANGELPILGAMHVHELQSIYRNIREEPDGMLGLEVMRRIHMCPRTVKQRIWQYEHAEEWADALQMYEQALRDEEDDQWCFGEREQGVLRCLMELGHFELLLHQAGGILASSSSLGPLLLPLAVDAAWRLQRWPLAEELLRKCDTEVKNFSSRSVSSSATAKKLFGSNLSCVTFGRVLLSLKSDSPSRFREIMESAHAEVMAQLGAASMESYQRAYPFLLRLHMLTEVEDGFRSRSSRGTVRAEDIEKLEWGARLSALTPNLREILPLLAVRQAIMQQHGLTELCIDNWLCLGREARVAGQFSVAALALQKAGILDANAQAKQRLIIQEGKLAHAQGRIDEAILLLEPIDKDVNRLREESRSCRTPDAKRQFSRRLLLATKWIVEAGQRHGTEVLRRYDLALSLHPSEKCYFALGQYNDFLYRAQLCATSDTGGSSAARPGKGLEADEVAQKYLISTLDAYAKSLMYGSKYIFQSMPRLLTLWLDVCSVNAAIADRGRSGGRSSGSAQNRRSSASDISGIQADCTAIVGKAISDVPSFMWYTCLPQLVSRVGHPNPEVKQTIVNCLVKVLSELPYHAMWHITGLSLSLNESRRELGSEIVRKAQMQLLDGGKDADSMSIGDAKRLFQDLIGCAKAGADDRAKSMKYPIGRNLELQRLIAPVQRALTVSLPAALAQKQKPALAARKKGSNRISGGDGNHVPFPVGQLHMQAFAEKIGIMNSKAKPKKLTLALLENASSINFLCKQERNGDLRKDARLMEFNGVVNRLLQRDPDGRRRKLSLRTYSVVCLNEECGLIEWVQGTAAFRQAVSESKNARPALSVPRLQEIIHTIQEKQTSVDAMVDLYQRKVLSVFPPTFHRWFLLHFREPTAWFDARTLFTRSAAVWSAVGHVVGLGDRHGENILLDTFSGECVHVDFDCIFDKGLTLRRPEIVPFRLTPNMVDGMGLTGYEGVYRRVMEVSMTVLRANRETLLSVLEPFLQDPTVGWGRTGRAQQDGTIVSSESACGDLARDIENEDARRTLKTIEERLSGMYNLRLPSKTKASSAKSSGRSSKAGLNNKSPGGSGGDAREIPLSIKGQVHRLIHESTSQANLCKMYIG